MPAASFLAQQGRALATRLSSVGPLALQEPMVPAAAVSQRALYRLEFFLNSERRRLDRDTRRFVSWLQTDQAANTAPEQLQRQFTLLKMRFNAVLSQFDIFADVLAQRSSHDIGVWLAGLDVLASSALVLPAYYEAPPVVCYADRGHGAAIRRVRTRLPGRTTNPVAIIRIPRERLIGSGIASSLVHEVGHQWSALLDLQGPLCAELRVRCRAASADERQSWMFWERWISEILSDFWAIAQVGVTSTLGLIGLVSLPRPFVFRVALDDPHPIPWMRVKLSIAIGRALYPHPQWRYLARLWESLYPREGLAQNKRVLLERLEATLPEFVALLLSHRAGALAGKTLVDIAPVAQRQPARLIGLYRSWEGRESSMSQTAPTLAVAALGQARFSGLISPEVESKLLSHLLRTWALKRSLRGET